MSAFDDEMRDVAIEILGDEDIGFEGVVTLPGVQSYNTTTLRMDTTPGASFRVLCAFTEPPDSRQYETDLSSEQIVERKWLIIVPKEPGEPVAGSILTAEGRDLTLKGVNPIGPKRGAIYYRAYTEK
jgi:hypothetical protein